MLLRGEKKKLKIGTKYYYLLLNFFSTEAVSAFAIRSMLDGVRTTSSDQKTEEFRKNLKTLGKGGKVNPNQTELKKFILEPIL